MFFFTFLHALYMPKKKELKITDGVLHDLTHIFFSFFDFYSNLVYDPHHIQYQSPQQSSKNGGKISSKYTTI